MKHWLTKKNTLLLSSSYFLLIVILFAIEKTCGNDVSCMVMEDEFPGILVFILFPLLPLFLLSLLTYRMKQEVFDHWMRFALWATPLLMALTFLINSQESSGGALSGAMSGAFDLLLLTILYGTYLIISLWMIFGKYFALKKK